jgi:hypothetical protein
MIASPGSPSPGASEDRAMADWHESAEATNSHPPPRVGLRRHVPSVLLGAFILFELIYLPAANFIKLVPLRLPESRGELDDDIQLRGKAYVEPVQWALDGLGTAMCRWGELTGQAQGWALFAPHFGHQASLPAVGVTAALLQSPFIPADPHVYFRLPGPSCRLFNYEYRLALLYWTWTEESYRERREEWDRAPGERVHRQKRSMLAYMRWRVGKYLRDNPGAAAPALVQLYADLIPSPPPEAPTAMRRTSVMKHAEWHRFALARWLPGAAPPPGYLPIQAPIWQVGWVWVPEED